MKFTRLALLSAVVLSLFSCENTVEESTNGISLQLAQLAKKASNYPLNEASEAIVDDMLTADLEFAVIHTSNYGNTVDVVAGGVVPNEASISINRVNLTPYAGRSYLSGDIPLNWFDGEVSMKDPSMNELATIRAPKVIQAPFLGARVLDVSQSHFFTWESDDTNLTEMVAIHVTYYDEVGASRSILSSDLFLVDDDSEAWDITTDLPAGAVAASYVLTRGNAVNFSNGSTEKVLFNVRSSDHHYYEFK